MKEDPFDFDTPIDRRGTASIKWDKYKGRDVIPLWVADMDFACAPAVVEALHRRVDHPIYGYSDPPSDLADTVVAHLEREGAVTHLIAGKLVDYSALLGDLVTHSRDFH